MATKKIDVEIGAKNKVAAGLKSARMAIKNFANTVGNTIKRLATSMVALGAASVAFGAKAVKAFMVQESAEKALSEAMLAHGDAVEDLLPKYKALAAAIQDETGIADEATLAMMANLRTIGVSNNKMEQAIKLTLALEKAGMRSKSALRAAADAMNGNTTALTTYLPALRQAKTDAEKLAIVNDLAARGYKQLTGELDTNKGRWTELKGRIGDFLEGVGRAIVENANFKNLIAELSARIKQLTESGKIDEWANKIVSAIRSLIEGFQKVIPVIQKIIAFRFEIMWIALAAAIGKVGIQTAIVITKMIDFGKAAIIASGGVAKLTASQIALKSVGLAGVFMASATAVAMFAKSVWESNKATSELIKSSNALKAMEARSEDKFGTRNAETLRRIRRTMQTGTEEEKAQVQKMFPKAVEEYEKAKSKKSGKATEEKNMVNDVAKNVQPMPIPKALPKVTQDTQMLDTGDLFTLMQTGTGAKRENELSELQGINDRLDKLIDVSGGIS